MITAEAMKPLGLALKDYYDGNIGAEVKVHRDDGVVSNMAVSAFFRGATDFQLDIIALDYCRGSVLDVGAGVGLHSLYLQRRDFSVCALDVSPEACLVMRLRGIQNVICSSISGVKAGPFDTLLILGRSITMVESLSGLYDFLRDARRLVKPGGQILLNSLDVSKSTDPRNLAYQEANRKAGRYIGEIRTWLEYKKVKGPVTGMLQVDDTTLAACAAKAGWACEILLRENDGNYLAKLTEKN